jgi:hypothetical protein
MSRILTILRAALCALLMAGYGGMYCGSILHDLGHEFSASETHDCGEQHLAITESHDGDHVDVTCFFCSHSQVISDDLVVEQNWTPAVASLAPPVNSVRAPHTSSLDLPSLRGPPTA